MTEFLIIVGYFAIGGTIAFIGFRTIKTDEERDQEITGALWFTVAWPLFVVTIAGMFLVALIVYPAERLLGYERAKVGFWQWLKFGRSGEDD